MTSALQDLLSPPQGVKTQIIELTPALAAFLLERNTNNRPMRMAHVQAMADDIIKGLWVLNGDAIRIRHDGILVDGQNRCAAVVKAGKPIKTVLITGLGDDAFKTIDKGAKRTLGDTIATQGEANYSILAAATRLLYFMQKSGGNPYAKASVAPSSQTLLGLIEANPALRESSKEAARLKKRILHLTPATIAICHFTFGKHFAVDTVHSFFEQLASGANLDDDSPILHLRNNLAKLGTSHKDNEKKVALTFRAFRFVAEGKKINLLRVNMTGPAADKNPFDLGVIQKNQGALV